MPMITYLELEQLPTLAVGQAANLKIDTGTMRVWVSRCGTRDGEQYPVQVERLIDGRWVDITGPKHAALVHLDGAYRGLAVQTLYRPLGG